MAGSARSIQASFFSGLRVASTVYTPAHSKNGKNISARLTINAFMNIPSRANEGEGRTEAVPFTLWDKMADIGAKVLSPGKEFNCLAQLHVYSGRVFVNNQPIADSQGNLIMTKKFSYTIRQITFGEESEKHIMNEIQAQLRPVNWRVPGHPEQLRWKEILKARMALAFAPNMTQYGFAKVSLPTGAGIGAYIPNAPASASPAAMGAALVTPSAVATAFGGFNTVAAPATPKATAGFFVPQGV
jgi:hypothetical protein